MTPKQRERWAWGFVVVLALLALAWATYLYWYRPHQAEQGPRVSRTFNLAPNLKIDDI
ncbi:MAG TPA: hypothetical protein PLV70_09055 [Flavobacteriales bacterium]|nr:hypothetical protein [Flavobacteriales bacterium]HRO41004.1 hypothetical protein [Flavobacteriales bacterium]HRQ85246.1 hypothetical protein [Flavobacteriales bacterium]